MAHDSNQSLRIGYLFFLVPTSNKPMGEEKIIFNEWKFEQSPFSFIKHNPSFQHLFPIIFSRPPKGFVKLNRDGEAKRNRGPTGAGGVLRDDISAIIFIFLFTWEIAPIMQWNLMV